MDDWRWDGSKLRCRLASDFRHIPTGSPPNLKGPRSAHVDVVVPRLCEDSLPPGVAGCAAPPPPQLPPHSPPLAVCCCSSDVPPAAPRWTLAPRSVVSLPTQSQSVHWPREDSPILSGLPWEKTPVFVSRVRVCGSLIVRLCVYKTREKNEEVSRSQQWQSESEVRVRLGRVRYVRHFKNQRWNDGKESGLCSSRTPTLPTIKNWDFVYWFCGGRGVVSAGTNLILPSRCMT